MRFGGIQRAIRQTWEARPWAVARRDGNGNCAFNSLTVADPASLSSSLGMASYLNEDGTWGFQVPDGVGGAFVLQGGSVHLGSYAHADITLGITLTENKGAWCSPDGAFSFPTAPISTNVVRVQNPGPIPSWATWFCMGRIAGAGGDPLSLSEIVTAGSVEGMVAVYQSGAYRGMLPADLKAALGFTLADLGVSTASQAEAQQGAGTGLRAWSPDLVQEVVAGAVQTVAADYTQAAGDGYIRASGSHTVTLLDPAVLKAGRQVTVKNIDPALTVTVACAHLIDGNASVTLAPGQAMTFKNGGTTWDII